MSQTYFVEKGCIHAIDLVGPNGLGVYSGKDQKQMEADRGAIEIMTDAALLARTRETCSTKPERTDLEQWEYSLNVLPPMNWRQNGYTESFMICEAHTADIHPIFVRIGEDYFTFRGPRSTAHHDLVKQVREHFNLDH